MRKITWLIKSIIYTIIVEFACFIPMWIETQYSKCDIFTCILLIMVFVVSASLYPIFRGKIKLWPLYDLSVVIVHLIFIPLRVNLLLDLNKNSGAFLPDLPIYFYECLVALFFVVLILSDVVFEVIDLIRNRVKKRTGEKKRSNKWLIKSGIFTVVIEIILFVLSIICFGPVDVALIRIMLFFPVWVIIAISYYFVKGNTDRPFLYILSIFATHIATNFVKVILLFWTLPIIRSSIPGTLVCIAITEVLFVALFIFDTVFSSIRALIKKHSDKL